MKFCLEKSVRMRVIKRKNRLAPFRTFIALRQIPIFKPKGHGQFGHRMRRNSLIIFILPASFLLLGNEIGGCRMYENNRPCP